jgi:aspartate-semialdehyde dehydrogenase
MRTHNVAIVGATGLVGRKIAEVLEQRNFPLSDIVFLASERSVGREIEFGGSVHQVRRLTPEAFKGNDLVFFAAGTTVSREFAMHAVRAGSVVIDNSSAFRMDDSVPLVVPEVNRKAIFHHKGIIANPNCSTIQMVVPLKPLHDRWVIKRIVVSTYQSVTGAGHWGVVQLEKEVVYGEPNLIRFPHQIAMNVLPEIDVFSEDGFSREEHKMIRETKKIMGDDTIKVHPTCVRVPVVGGHSEAVNVEFEKRCELNQIREVLQSAPGVILQDDPARHIYPMPINVKNRDEVFVGRIRRDETVPHGYSFWIVADNLRKGAATNAVQIAEEFLKGH